jgi:hypothetical protein
MRVWFQDFSSADPQLSLFTEIDSNAEKMSSVTQALDRIRERYGGEVIGYGRTV